jgi:hypothetical protein
MKGGFMNSISGLGAMSTMQMQMGGMRRQNVELTEDQKSTIEDILSQYDSSNLTEEDAKSIFDAFRDAGIPPGSAMKEAVEEAGFDLEKFKPQGGPPPPPPSGGMNQELNVESLQSLQTILNQFDLTNLSAEDEDSLFSQIQQAGFMTPGNLFTIDA